jgi:hypothetical protein
MSDQALTERKVDHDLADTIAIGKGGINFDNAGQVMEYAKLMAASQSAVPKHLRGQPGACLGILDDAIRFGINPYALARKSYFVNDTLAYEAAVFMAVVNAHAPLKTRPDIKWQGEGPERVCIVTGIFRDGAVREYRSPRFADIQPKNSPLWKHDPDQQQSYFSLRGFARRWCPEVILGIHDVDELREAAMTDVTPKPEPAAATKRIPRSLDEFAAAASTGAEQSLSSEPSAEAVSPSSAAAEGGGGEGLQQASAAADESATIAPMAVGAGSGEATEPPSPTSSLPPAGAERKALIESAMQLATRPGFDADARLVMLDELRAEAGSLSGLPADFIRTVVEAAAKVVRKELPKGAVQKYLDALP